MANPLFGGFKPPYPMPQKQDPMSMLNNMLTEFNNFKAMYQGNPYQQVQQLISSGQLSQEKFQQLSEMAKQIQTLFRV